MQLSLSVCFERCKLVFVSPVSTAPMKAGVTRLVGNIKTSYQPMLLSHVSPSGNAGEYQCSHGDGDTLGAG